MGRWTTISQGSRTGLVAKAGEDFKGREVHPLFENVLLLAPRVDVVSYHRQISTMRRWARINTGC